MNVMLLNILVAGVAILVVFTLWIGVHLLARKRMGERKLGCRGPMADAEGNVGCCMGDPNCQEPRPESRGPSDAHSAPR